MGYATAFIDGDAVSSRSSLSRVRLKSFGGSDADAVNKDARRISQRFADHCLSAVFDQVLEAYAPSFRSFGEPPPALCFGAGGLLFDQQSDYLREFWRKYAGVGLSPVLVILSTIPPRSVACHWCLTTISSACASKPDIETHTIAWRSWPQATRSSPTLHPWTDTKRPSCASGPLIGLSKSSYQTSRPWRMQKEGNWLLSFAAITVYGTGNTMRSHRWVRHPFPPLPA